MEKQNWREMDRTYKILKTINFEMEENKAYWNKQFNNLDHIALLVIYKPDTEDSYKRVEKGHPCGSVG